MNDRRPNSVNSVGPQKINKHVSQATGMNTRFCEPS